jgi:polysaccharide export outer membrane protein
MRRALLAGSILVLALAGCAARAPVTREPSASAPPAGTAAAARQTPASRPDAGATGRAAPAAAPALATGAARPTTVAGPAPQAADSEYRVAPRDQLMVQVHGQDDLTRTVRVSQGGTITLPLLGEVQVAGLTTREIETKIEGALKPAYLRDPRVSVSVAEYQGRQVTVIGAVNQPGAYAFRANRISLLQALSEAHGVRENADRIAYVLRRSTNGQTAQPIEIDLDQLFRNGQDGGLVLEGGDSVYVPEANTFYVTGEVEKRGAYTLRRDTTVSKALVEAGGVTRKAAGAITIVRTVGRGERQEIAGLNLDAIMKGDPKQDLPLQAQDVVVVPQSGAKAVGYGFLEFVRGLFSIGIPLIP